MFEKGEILKSGSTVQKGGFQKGEVLQGIKTFNYEAYKQAKKEAEQAEKKQKVIDYFNNAVEAGKKENIAYKLSKGENLTDEERLYISVNGVSDLNSPVSYDINAIDNPVNVNRVKSTEAEDIKDNIAIKNALKADRKNLTLSSDTKKNTEQMNTVAAKAIYNDVIYNRDVQIGGKKFKTESVADVLLANTQAFGRKVDQYMKAGIAQYAQGINQAFKLGKDDTPTDAYTLANAAIKEYYDRNGKRVEAMFQDVVTNIGNNLIPMGVGMVTGTLATYAIVPIGATATTLQQGILTGINAVSNLSTMGVSVFGNSCKEAEDLGVSGGRKISYALLNTACEVGLETAIGGLPGVGGALSGDLISSLSKNVSSILGKTVIRIIGNGIGEFVEESAQSIINPLLQKLILGADVDTIFTNPKEQLSAAAYDGFIGFVTSVLTGGFIEYDNAVIEAGTQVGIGQYGAAYNQNLKNNSIKVADVAQYFKEVSPKGSDLYKAADKVTKVKAGNENALNLAVGEMLINAENVTQKVSKKIYSNLGSKVKESENGIANMLESYENFVKNGITTDGGAVKAQYEVSDTDYLKDVIDTENNVTEKMTSVDNNGNTVLNETYLTDSVIFPSKVSELYDEISTEYKSGNEVSDELIGNFLYNVQVYAPRAVVISEVYNRIARKNDPQASSSENDSQSTTNSVEQSTETGTNAVLSEPSSEEYTEKVGAYEAIRGANGEEIQKTGRHKHIERAVEKIGAKLIWSTKVSRGKYIPSSHTIILNPSLKTAEAYNFVLKHEFTHFLKGKKSFESFERYVFNNSKLFEDWARDRLADNTGSRTDIVDRITDLYYDTWSSSDEVSDYVKKNFSMEAAREEVIADFVGEYLLGTEEKLEETLYMLSEMKQKKRTLFERVRDFFRDIAARLKGFKSLEKDLAYLNGKLERVAQSKDIKTTDTEVGEKYIVEYTTDNIPVAVIEENILDGVPKSDWVKTVKETISEKFSNGIPISGRLIRVNSITKSEYTNSKYSKYLKSSDGTIYADKFKSANNLDDIVLASTNYINEDLKHTRKDNFKEFARGDVLIRVGNNDYSAKVIVGFTSGNQMVLYDVVDFTPTEFSIKKERTHQGYAEAGSPRKDVSSTDSISNSAENVKKNIFENTENYSETSQNIDEKLSIPVTEMDKLLDQYDNGEITREEYYGKINYRVNRQAKAASEKYIADWQRKHGTLMQRTLKAEEIRETAIRNERREQELREDRERNIKSVRQTVSRLDKALRANSKAKHIPEGLKGAVTEFCKVFFENDISPFDKKDLSQIATYYKELGMKKSETELAENRYDPAVQDCLDMLVQLLPNKKLTEMSNLELELVRYAADGMNAAVSGEAKIFIDGRKESFKRVAEAALEEIIAEKPTFLTKGSNSKSLETAKSFFVMGNMKPVYFFELLGETFEEAYNDLVNAQGKFGKNMDYSRKFIAETKTKHNYDLWKNDILTYETENGDRLDITVEQALQLVATAQREKKNKLQASGHLNEGGVVFDTAKIKENSKKLKGTDKKEKKKAIKAEIEKLVKSGTVQITFRDAAGIEKMLKKEQKEYMKAFVEFLSTECAAWGNETSMQLYGYRMFNESNYFPYVSAQEYLTSDPAEGENYTLRNVGFTHSLQRNANNPLLISSFTDVAIEHIESMTTYSTMTAPIDTLTKLLNYETRAEISENGTRTEPRSIRAEIKQTYGDSAVKYFENFIADLNKGLRSDNRDKFLRKVTSGFKKSAVLANLSVIIQQPTAIIRAMQDMDAKYFLKAGKYKSDNNYEEMKEYAPVAIIKQMGSFDTGVGATNSQWLSGEASFRNNLDERLGAGAEKADEIAWSFLWSACKAEIADTTKLEVGSEAFLEAAGKRATDLINRTQVYDSVLSKSQNMRSKGIAGTLTSFMAEPTTAINMLWSAFAQHSKGKVSGKRVARTITALIASQLINSMFASLVYAMRDDDDDKSFLEKYVKSFTSEFLNSLNPLTNIPYISDIFSLWDGYDVERQDVTLVANLIDAVKALSSEQKTTPEKIRKLAEAISDISGIPLKNVLRDMDATVRLIQQMFDDMLPTADGLKIAVLEGVGENNLLAPFGINSFDYSKTGEYKRMAKAIKKGDDKAYNASYQRLIKNGTATDSSIRSGVTAQLKKDKVVRSETDKIMDKLDENNSFESLDEEDKSSLENDIASALAKEIVVENEAGDEYDKLYEYYRTDKEKYKVYRKKLLESGKTERQIDDGLEIAKYAFMKSVGIDLHEYFLFKYSTKSKYADSDDSGGVSKSEKENALKNIDIDSKTRQQIRKYLIEGK